MDHGDVAGGFARFRSTKAWASFAPLSIWIVVLCAVLRSVLLWDPHESRRYGCVGRGLVGGVRENGRLSVQEKTDVYHYKKKRRLSLQETRAFISARKKDVYQCDEKRAFSSAIQTLLSAKKGIHRCNNNRVFISESTNGRLCVEKEICVHQ